MSEMTLPKLITRESSSPKNTVMIFHPADSPETTCLPARGPEDQDHAPQGGFPSTELPAVGALLAMVSVKNIGTIGPTVPVSTRDSSSPKNSVLFYTGADDGATVLISSFQESTNGMDTGDQGYADENHNCRMNQHQRGQVNQ